MSAEAAPRSVAVFRALQLGDMLCAVPVLRALRMRWPAVRITLIGLPWARAFVERFSRYVDDMFMFPGFPGFPERDFTPAEVTGFLAEAQRRRFDLALQLHGSGELSNAIVALLGARRVAGFARAGRYRPAGTFAEWRDDDHEAERGMRLLAALGVPPAGTQLEFPLADADRREWAELALRGGLGTGSYVCVHPGSQLPSRRWHGERFAAVADALARDGLQVVMTGTAGEADIVASVIAAMRERGVDLAGRTSLGALGALVDGARLVISNDTGIRHVAAARGTPCVAVACGSDVRRWGARGARERLVFAHVECRPCAHAVCPVGHGCASAVTSDAVVAAARELLSATAISPERRSCGA